MFGIEVGIAMAWQYPVIARLSVLKPANDEPTLPKLAPG
jgi:hypothetical protein